MIDALPPDRLYRRCDEEAFAFSTTADLPELDEMIWQQRAVDAIGLAIAIRRPGYNMFVLGPTGTGKHRLVREMLERRSREEPTPDDWCYVNNFAAPQTPKALRLPAGRARTLKEAMAKLIGELRGALPAAFESEDYRARRQVIEAQFKRIHERAFQEIQKAAEAEGVGLIRTPMGLALAPIRDGEVISPEQFQKLPEAERERLKSAIERLQRSLEATVAKVPQWERDQREAVRKLNQEVVRFAIGHLISEVRERFAELPEIVSYLGEVEADLVDNTEDFLTDGGSGSEEAVLKLSSTREASAFRRYQVNVIVDRTGAKGAPVVYEDNPRHQLLVGRVEHLARLGMLVTDFNLIRPGALHRANGGYLVLDARRLLAESFAWDALKLALQAREIRIESLEQRLSLSAPVSLEPEPIPLDVKVVLVAEPVIYYLLSAYDPEFADLFKIGADFDDRTERDAKGMDVYARLLGGIARNLGTLPLDRSAVARMVEHSSRIAGDTQKLTAVLRPLNEIVAEADHWARQRGGTALRADDVELAIAGRRRRSDRLYQRIQEEIERGTLLIDIEGGKVGQINALSVNVIGEQVFGHPSRVSCRIRLGRGEVIDIEREVELGGPIHSKGVMILAGFVGGRYSGERPLSLHASLVFEQSYGAIEGDSASLAELCALISVLGDLPIDQGKAVTGAVNQFGDVQAIGAVNEKIEGYYDACLRRGLNGRQGVLIPQANVKSLMLRSDVVASAAKGEFHVWPVTTVDQAIELLTGIPAGERGVEGYPAGTVNHRVEARLQRLCDRATEFAMRQMGRES